MNYVTYSELVADSLRFARTLPRNVFGVLGVPHSGLLPATIVAQELGVRLGDVYSYTETGGHFYRAGSRLSGRMGQQEGVLLVLDDSVYRGQAMTRARKALQGAQTVIEYAAIYADPMRGTGHVDRWVREVPSPRLFEWNWLHAEIIESALCDMDGIFCEDPEVFDDDGPRYKEDLACRPKLRVPRRRVGAIVTGRLHKWRHVTQDWLRQHGVEYDNLVMAPFDSPEERRAYGAGRWKAEEYVKAKKAKLFVESDEAQAREIAKITGRPVLCPVVGRLFYAPKG